MRRQDKLQAKLQGMSLHEYRVTHVSVEYHYMYGNLLSSWFRYCDTLLCDCTCAVIKGREILFLPSKGVWL